MPGKKMKEDPEAGTEKAPSQAASIAKYEIPGIGLGGFSREGLQAKIKSLQTKAEVTKRGRKRKAALISLYQETYRLLDGSVTGMYELARFLYRGSCRVKNRSDFEDWVGFTIGGSPARRLIQVYKRYGDRLQEFAHLGLEKLWIASKLDDCVGYVERHEEAIAAQSEKELRLLVQAFREIRPRVALVDGNEDHIYKLRRELDGCHCKVEKIVMQPTPDVVTVTAERIMASDPDLLIVNAQPLSELGNRAHGIRVVERLRRQSNIPVIFYRMEKSIEKSSVQMWSRLISLKPLALLRTPIHKDEVRSTLNLAIRAIRAEKQLQWVHEDLEKLVGSRTEQLQNEVQARRSAEEAAIASHQRLQAVFDRAADAIFIKDKSLRYQMVNQAMVLLLGHEESRVLGKTDEDFFEQDVAEHFKGLEQRVLLGEAVEEQHSRLIHGMEMTFLDSRVPLRGGSGEIVGLCGFSRDVTERQGIGKGQFTIEHEYTSPAMRFCLEQAHVAADSDSIVLLLGESGSGKDHLARYIHDHSRRAVGPYFAINCAAVANEVAESELFGHEKGAYTGAASRKRGLLELAEGGTLLLNEIGELSLPLQAKLLTFLDTKKFTRVGGEREVEVNARLVAATNRDLELAVQDGVFRSDLFYRLYVMPIIIPPLRERRDDLPLLVKVILRQLCEEMQYAEPPIMTPSTMKAFKDYGWPGNVRELRNVLERALILSGGARVDIVSDGGTIGPRSLGLPDQAATEKEEMRDLRRGQIAWTNPAVSDKGLEPAVTNFHRLSPEEQGRHLKIILEDVCGGESGSKGYLSDVIGLSTRTIDKRIKLVGGVELKTGSPRNKAREEMIPKIEQYFMDNFAE